jgi:hypothetical protein
MLNISCVAGDGHVVTRSTTEAVLTRVRLQRGQQKTRARRRLYKLVPGATQRETVRRRTGIYEFR